MFVLEQFHELAQTNFDSSTGIFLFIANHFLLSKFSEEKL